MDNSIYVALSKQVGVSRQLNVVANNIANAQSVGFKSEEMVFKSYMVDDARNEQTAYAQDIGTVRDFSQGGMELTNNPFDFAIQGKGFFAIQAEDGVRYTRAGNFTIDSEGALATQDGYKVLDDAQGVIEFEETDVQVVVSGDGRIEVDGEERANLGVFLFNDERNMKAAGSATFETTELPITNDGQSSVAQGVLENSNVESVSQITELIKLQRQYTGTAKYINELFEVQDDAIRRIARPA